MRRRRDVWLERKDVNVVVVFGQITALVPPGDPGTQVFPFLTCRRMVQSVLQSQEPRFLQISKVWSCICWVEFVANKGTSGGNGCPHGGAARAGTAAEARAGDRGGLRGPQPRPGAARSSGSRGGCQVTWF